MNRGAILVVLAFLLYSCGPGASASTPTPPPTASFTSSPSPSPTLTPTSTTKPKPTWTPKPPFSLPLPIGTPARKWNGITVMPGAIAGEELDPTTYAFTTRSGPDEIERYMTTQMAKIGWHFLATGTGETGGPCPLLHQGWLNSQCVDHPSQGQPGHVLRPDPIALASSSKDQPPNHSLVPTRLPPQGARALASYLRGHRIVVVPATPRGTVRGR